MSTLPATPRFEGVTAKTVLKPYTVPFNKPFHNQLNFGEIIAPSFDCSSLFRGKYANLVHQYFKENYGSEEVVLTASCTNALELAALLLDLKPGDEVIIPAYTYVSTANAFELRGAKLVLCDSAAASPNLDLQHLETLITAKTKAIVVIHYGGISVNMYRVQEIARRHGVLLIEDAAHAVEAYYDGIRLGTFGDLATFSFHETKNITCGQGGLLLINNPKLVSRAYLLRDCGTNRHNFYLGLVDKYTWVDVGSVYNLSELNCAYLYPQLTHIEQITQKRVELWDKYYHGLKEFQDKGYLKLPFISNQSQHNAHIFYITLNSQADRDRLLYFLKERGIIATFHYSGLHQCPYYQKRYKKTSLANAEKYSGRLLRLPLFYDLSFEEQAYVLECLHEYFHTSARRPYLAQGLAALPVYVSSFIGEQTLLTDCLGSVIQFLG
ncbi:MAG: dTDP-4-amino-4,6-dideoxygalactose transaminase [Saprospiraceae bacterium]|nr:dTDP-4-amino-4,6-dideoxygalactose transaminase [Saprospiraceae bacterium]